MVNQSWYAKAAAPRACAFPPILQPRARAVKDALDARLGHNGGPPIGRPMISAPELRERILDRLGEGIPICSDADLPARDAVRRRLVAALKIQNNAKAMLLPEDKTTAALRKSEKCTEREGISLKNQCGRYRIRAFIKATNQHLRVHSSAALAPYGSRSPRPMAGKGIRMSDNLTSLYLTNPALAQTLRRQALAQSMMQDAGNTAPASPWQAVARVAQGLVGGILGHDANQEIKSAADAQQQQMSDSTAQLVAALTGQPPATTMPPGAPMPRTMPTASPDGTGPGLADMVAGRNFSASPSIQQAPPSTSGSGSGSSGQSGSPPSSLGAPSAAAPLNQRIAAVEAPAPGQSPMNGLGYAGRYQFGAAALAHDGLYTPAPDEDLAANQWKGTISIPGTPFKPMTVSEFVASPAAQDAAFNLHSQKLQQQMLPLLQKYGGQTIGGVPVTPDSLVALAHFAGPDGAQKFLESGGQYNPADTNGTRVSDYVGKVLGTGNIPDGAGSAGGGNQGGGTSQPQIPSQVGSIPDPLARAQALRQWALTASNSPNPVIRQQAQLAAQMAGQMLTIQNWQPATINGMTGQRNIVTNEFKPYITGTGRFATDAKGNLLLAPPGGGAPQVVSPNASGLTGNSPEVAAARTMLELRPKIADGSATPQEIATYNTAAGLFQAPKPVITSPGQTVTPTETRPLPAGMPVPGAPGGPPGGVMPAGGPTSPAQAPTPPLPAAAPPPGAPTSTPYAPQIRANIYRDLAGKDADQVAQDEQKAGSGVHTLGITSTIRSMLPGVTTGTGADARLLVSQFAAALGVSPDQVEKMVGTNPVMGELLQKNLFQLSTGATRAMGAREPGSVMMMFQKNYPNLSSRDMTIDAMTRLLDMDQIRQQDYAQAKRSYLNDSVRQLSDEGGYRGLTGFDNEFDQQNTPRIYESAALASGGMPYSAWSHGLTPAQQTQALQLAHRVYPDATVLDGKGVPHRFGGQ